MDGYIGDANAMHRYTVTNDITRCMNEFETVVVLELTKVMHG